MIMISMIYELFISGLRWSDQTVSKRNALRFKQINSFKNRSVNNTSCKNRNIIMVITIFH